MPKVLIINASRSGIPIQKYVLNNIYEECYEIFMSEQQLLTFNSRGDALPIPDDVREVILYFDEKVNFQIFFSHKPTRVYRLSGHIGPSFDQQYVYTILLSGRELHNFTLYKEHFENVQGRKKFEGKSKDGKFFYINQKNMQTINLVKDEEELHFSGNSHKNIIEGKNSNDYVYLHDNSHNNIIRAREGYDFCFMSGLANNNEFHGGEDTDNIFLTEYAAHNKIFGGSATDDFQISFYANNNEFHGEQGEDKFKIMSYAYENKLFGGAGKDFFHLLGHASKNTVRGGQGCDEIRLKQYSSSNILFGGYDEDEFYLLENSSHNTIYAGDQGDHIELLGFSNNNLVHGGNDNDLVISMSYQNTIYGDNGKDFLLSYIPFANGSNSTDLVTLNGGHGDDTIMSAMRFWYHKKLDERAKQYTVRIHAGSGDDIVNPYLDPKTLTIIHDKQSTKYKRDEGNKIEIAKGSKYSLKETTDHELNIQYEIRLGYGYDTLHLYGSKTAYNCQTRVYDYCPGQDKFVFHNNEHAYVFFEKCYQAKFFGFNSIEYKFNGHKYRFDIENIPENTIDTLTVKDDFGLDVMFPRFNAPKMSYGKVSETYLQTTKQHLFFFKKDILEKIDVSTKPVLFFDKNLVLSTHQTFHAKSANFIPFFMFEGSRLKFYDHLQDETKSGYWKKGASHAVPDNVFAVIVWQKQKGNTAIFVNGLEQKREITAYKARDFFTKGSFKPLHSPISNTVISLGLIMQSKSKTSGTRYTVTPMSEPITIR